MSAKSMHEAKEQLCKLFDEVTKDGNIKLGDLEAINYLTNSIKNIMKINEMDEGGYSYGMGDWNASGRYSNDGYANNGSYEGMGYSNGRYDDTMSGRRHYVRGHYSRGDMVTERIEEMMNDNRLTSSDKDTLRKAMDILRK